MSGFLEFDIGEIISDKRISVQIRRVGQEYCEPRKKSELRRGFSYHSLHFVLFGRGTLIANGESISLSRGDAFILYAGEKYEYYPDASDPWSYLWIDFYCDGAQKIFDRCGFSVQKPTVHLPEFSEYMEILKSIYESYDAGPLQELNSSAYFMLLLGKLIGDADKARHAADHASIKYRHIREILTYINNNYRMELSVQKIARENCLSVSRMMALFSEVVGMSPVVYINRFRVSASCELLAQSDMSIAEIANAVGVEDPLYFTRIFRKVMGVSPREYRSKGVYEDPYAWLKEKGMDFR